MYAILIPYIETEEGDCLLLEVRSMHVPQPGEVCFPGGKIEAGETAAEAAIRETCEELSIPPSSIKISEELAPELMEDGRRIYPVTARLSPSALDSIKPSCAEVASFFLLPLSWLKNHNPACYRLTGSRIDMENLPTILREYLSHYAPFQNTHDTFYWEYENHGIWGMTARVIRRLLPD